MKQEALKVSCSTLIYFLSEFFPHHYYLDNYNWLIKSVKFYNSLSDKKKQPETSWPVKDAMNILDYKPVCFSE